MAQTIDGTNGPFVSLSNASGQWVATITWTDPTGVNGYGQVMYGDTPTNLNSSNTENNTSSSHSLQVTGLTDGATYYYNVSTLDSNGNTLAQSATSSFAAAPQQVTGAPQSSSPNPTSANISWQANVAGLGQINLGTSPAGLTTKFADNVNAFSHAILASPLQAGTQYFYNVCNLDGQGNVLAQSATASFTTPPSNVQVKLTQPQANPWIAPRNHPSTLSVKVVLANGTPQAGITVNFRVLGHLGGNGQIISSGGATGSSGNAVSDATGTAAVQFLGSMGEIATIEATSPNSNSHLVIPVAIL